MQGGNVDSGALRLLQPGEVGVDHLPIAIEAEDQRHVDADPGADRLGDRLKAGDGRRDLDQGVRSIHRRPELSRLRDGGRGIVRQTGLHLDGDTAVETGGRLVDGQQDVTGRGHVIRGDLEDRVGGAGAGGRQPCHLLGVGVSLRQRAGEDGRVGRDAHDVTGVDQLLQIAAHDPLAAEVIEPDAHAGGRDLGERVGCLHAHCLHSYD